VLRLFRSSTTPVAHRSKLGTGGYQNLMDRQIPTNLPG
jgi:hypothetical protein